MYVPHQFENKDLDQIKNFIRSNSFGILITSVDNAILGSHIPLELEQDPQGQEVIYGHLAKANSQCKHLVNGAEVLAIYNGPHSYVSSSWYDHENVPTWNYIAIHVEGKIKVINEYELLESLDKLMNRYEKHQSNPVRMDELSDATLRQIRGIKGFKIMDLSVKAAYKLSQNRNDHDYKNIISHLNNSGDKMRQNVANEMKKLRK